MSDAEVHHRLIKLLELRELRDHGVESRDGGLELLLLKQACAEVVLSFVLSWVVWKLSQESLPFVAGQVVQLLILKPDGRCELTRRCFRFLSGRRVNNRRQRREADQNR